MCNITYAIDLDTGLVISRVGSELAWPILDYEGMGILNNFKMSCYLEIVPLPILSHCWQNLKWTRKIPVEIKNFHRRFWGFKELKIRGKK